MGSFAQMAQDNRNAAVKAVQDLYTLAADEGRDLSAEEQEQADRMEADVSAWAEKRDKAIRAESLAAEGAIARGETGERIERPAFVVSEDETLAAVRSALRGIKDDKRIGEQVLDLRIDHAKVLNLANEMRAIADFSDSAALYMNDFSTRVAVYQRTMSPWLSVASVIEADNGRPLVLPNFTVDPTVVAPGEGTAITENSGTLGEATATPTAYKALSYISSEAEEDELVGLMQLISAQQGRQLGFTAGTAMSAAVVAAATNGGTANGLSGGSTATFFGYEDLLDLKYGIAAPYRLAGAWVMSNGAIKKARKYTDKNGQYLWQPAIAAGQPDQFDGQAVYEDPGLAAPASVTKSVLYGDLSAWVVKMRGLRVAVSQEFRFSNDQVAIRSVLRVGGALPDASAIRYLISANT